MNSIQQYISGESINDAQFDYENADDQYEDNASDILEDEYEQKDVNKVDPDQEKDAGQTLATKAAKQARLDSLKMQSTVITLVLWATNVAFLLSLLALCSQLFPPFVRLDIVGAANLGIQFSYGGYQLYDSMTTSGFIYDDKCPEINQTFQPQYQLDANGHQYKLAYYLLSSAAPGCSLNNCLFDPATFQLSNDPSSASPCSARSDYFAQQSYSFQCRLTGSSTIKNYEKNCHSSSGTFYDFPSCHVDSMQAQMMEAFRFRSPRQLYVLGADASAYGSYYYTSTVSTTTTINNTGYGSGYNGYFYEQQNLLTDNMFPPFRTTRYAIIPKSWSNNFTSVYNAAYENFTSVHSYYDVRCQRRIPGNMTWTDIANPGSTGVFDNNQRTRSSLLNNGGRFVLFIQASCALVQVGLIEVIKILILLSGFCVKGARIPRSMVFTMNSPLIPILLLTDFYRTLFLYSLRKRNPIVRTAIEFFLGGQMTTVCMLISAILFYGQPTQVIALAISALVINMAAGFYSIVWHSMLKMNIDLPKIRDQMIQ